MTDTTPIAYRDFWDVPRIFVAEFRGKLYLFDCPFDRDLEDYPDTYAVYILPEMSREQIDEDWAGLPAKALRKVGDVPISAIRFDPTKRKEIGVEVFDLLKAPSANGAIPQREEPARIA